MANKYNSSWDLICNQYNHNLIIIIFLTIIKKMIKDKTIKLKKLEIKWKNFHIDFIINIINLLFIDILNILVLNKKKIKILLFKK